MAGRRVSRPASVAELSLPSVDDPTTDAALQLAEQAIVQLQRRLAVLQVAVDAIDTSTVTPVVVPVTVFDTIIDMTGSPITFGAVYDNWNVGTLGQWTLIMYITDGIPPGSSSRAVRGLAGGAAGKMVTLVNMGNSTGVALLAHESGSALAANQFHNAGAGNASGGTLGSLTYWHQGLWRQIGGT